MRSPTLPRPAGAASVTLCVARLQDVALTTAHGLLSAAELQRAQGIGHRATREQFVRTRALLRLLLGRCTGRPPASLVLDDANGEAPRLAGNGWGLYFNVSHSYEWAAVAAARFPIGIDIERIDAGHDWQPIADILFHPGERQRLQHTAPAARAGFFFETWTRKEAYLKGIGTGLRLDPASFDTTAPGGAVAGAAPASAERWYTQPLGAPAGYAAALAIRGPALATPGMGDRLVHRVELGDLFRDTRPAGILCASADIPFGRIVLS
jgi:4'-phosphopantetheinyl transferase